jgi:hypothetical protein
MTKDTSRLLSNDAAASSRFGYNVYRFNYSVEYISTALHYDIDRNVFEGIAVIRFPSQT